MSPTWIIDSLEEESAQIEEDGVRVIHVPRSILPPGAAEGDVLTVALERQRRGKREAVRVTITLDPEATKEAMEKSQEQVNRIRKASRRRDSGGDVVL
jgi:ACT domain-containing protein